MMPAAGEIKERRAVGEMSEERHAEKDSEGAEEAFVADGEERWDAVTRHDLLFHDKLGCGANGAACQESIWNR